ncbi:MAG: hypothetical protein AAF390_15380, partial [Pseudomonadota bacterium]
MPTTATLPAPTLPTMPAFEHLSRRPRRALWTIAAALAAAMLAGLLTFHPFAQENTHLPPAKLAAWQEIMRDG